MAKVERASLLTGDEVPAPVGEAPAPKVSRKKRYADEVEVAQPLVMNYEPRWASTIGATAVAAREFAKFGAITLRTLSAMARTFVPAAVIAARTNDVAEFSTMSSDMFEPGWRMRMRNPTVEPTRRDKKRMAQLAEAFLRGGGDMWPNGMEGVLRAIVPQTLAWDRYTFEVLRHSDGTPMGLVPVDGATMAKAIPVGTSATNGRWYPRGNDTAYYQIIDNKIVSAFRKDQIGWGVRNPSTHVNTFGQGVPELEVGLPLITDLLNIYTANATRASGGLRSDALLLFKTDGGTRRFRAVEEQILAAMSNNVGRQRTPLIQVDPNMKEDVVVVPLHHPTSELELGQQLSLLTKYVCALYDVDPARIQQVFGTEGQTSTVESGKGLSARIENGRRSAIPTLRNIQATFNQSAVWPTDPNYVFEFTGIQVETKDAMVKRLSEEVRLYKSPNEARAELGMPPNDDPVSRYPLDAAYSPWLAKVIENSTGAGDDLMSDMDMDFDEFIEGKRVSR